MEKRFGINCPNISPWRRAITGDLTQAFNFTNPDYSWPKLPKTTGDWIRTKVECLRNPPPEVPIIQSMPVQEPGYKKSRALDYQLDAKMTYEGGDSLKLEISSNGKNGAAFQLHNLLYPDLFPLKYTVEGEKSLIDTSNVHFDSSGNYSFSLHGPNGYVRQFTGNVNDPDLNVTLEYEPSKLMITLS